MLSTARTAGETTCGHRRTTPSDALKAWPSVRYHVIESLRAASASDWAIVTFNTDIEDFPSWEAFATAVLAQVVPGTRGTCYAYSEGTVHVTREPLPGGDQASGWQKTGGKGWQQVTHGRRFIAYRCNATAQVLLWVEGVNPRWCFAHIRKMCEVPLGAVRQEGLAGPGV
jgi:hypothetical protein